MRWIFISLLLANAALFVWYSVESGREERLEALNASSITTDSGLVSGAPLTLVSELTKQERLNLSKPKPAAESQEQAATMTAALSPTAVAETQQPQQPQPLQASQPLPELASQNASATGAVKPIEETATPLEPNQCLMLGPISVKQVEQLSQRLMAVTIISESIDVDVKGAPEYWVVLPPFTDDKAAFQKLQELQGRGVQAQILPSGPLANAISFGLRGQKSEAAKLAAELQTKGYHVEVRAVPITLKERWLSLSERQAPKLNDEIWHGIQQDFPKLEKRIKSCH